jgi:hypothetical protein
MGLQNKGPFYQGTLYMWVTKTYSARVIFPDGPGFEHATFTHENGSAHYARKYRE